MLSFSFCIFSDEGDCTKDAVFLSTHKFVGGVGTPGILIAKKSLFVNRVPGGVGGGTVHYVSKNSVKLQKKILVIEKCNFSTTSAITFDFLFFYYFVTFWTF